MLVGEPFGGKTKVLESLAETMTDLNEKGITEYEKVLFRTVNPKAITMGQLYGQFDPVSHEWSDGIVANTFREFAFMDTPDRKWVVFDGPIDAVWIESMNTVLDDNKKLCLVSGEIIQMSAVMSLIFETMDLSQASPATVSRCGMIYMEPTTLGWRPLFKSWLNANPESIKQHNETLELLFEWLVDPVYDFVRKNCKYYTPSGQSNLIRSLMYLVEMLLHDAAIQADQEENKHLHVWLITAFLFAITWSLGAIIDGDSRPKFDQFLRDLLAGKSNDFPIPKALGKLDMLFPNENTVFDYYYEVSRKTLKFQS